MNSIVSTSRTISKKSLTFNKSFFISIAIHILIIFGISITTYYKIPLFNETPIINVKLANSDQDLMTDLINRELQNSKKNLSTLSKGTIETSNNISTSYKVKRLQANSIVNSEEAVYLNLWQREIETAGDKIIASNQSSLSGTVQIMAKIDIYGNLVSSEILISSGNTLVDQMAISILNESAPFAPFNETMSNEYSLLEIVRDWNFSPN
jgi:outer membrane biosynthesis protein TonB|tara:strand:- start:155 stop:781 length:627 start_codon:yes stop_codon:yes gene_type:complete